MEQILLGALEKFSFFRFKLADNAALAAFLGRPSP